MRDLSRLRDARARMNECPLGAAALAGTGLSHRPGDRRRGSWGSTGRWPILLDAVSDRDFALEFLAVATISAMAPEPAGEELVIWSSAQFRFVRLVGPVVDGSSIMPQKRNPDAAELLRAKIGRNFSGRTWRC